MQGTQGPGSGRSHDTSQLESLDARLNERSQIPQPRLEAVKKKKRIKSRVVGFTGGLQLVLWRTLGGVRPLQGEWAAKFPGTETLLPSFCFKYVIGGGRSPWEHLFKSQTHKIGWWLSFSLWLSRRVWDVTPVWQLAWLPPPRWVCLRHVSFRQLVGDSLWWEAE